MRRRSGELKGETPSAIAACAGDAGPAGVRLRPPVKWDSWESRLLFTEGTPAEEDESWKWRRATAANVEEPTEEGMEALASDCTIDYFERHVFLCDHYGEEKGGEPDNACFGIHRVLEEDCQPRAKKGRTVEDPAVM